LAIKGKFDAVLDTIGVPETERIGINFLKRGGHYMTLQVDMEVYHLFHPYHTCRCTQFIGKMTFIRCFS